MLHFSKLNADGRKRLLAEYFFGLADSTLKINEAVESLRRRESRTIFIVGVELIRANKKLAHHGNGTFDEYIRRELPISRSTAYKWKKVVEVFGDCPHCRQSIDPSALYLLALDDTPDRARKRAVKLAAKGERVRLMDAKRFVDEEQDWLKRDSEMKGNGGSADSTRQLIDLRRQFQKLWRDCHSDQKRSYRIWEHRFLTKLGFRFRSPPLVREPEGRLVQMQRTGSRRKRWAEFSDAAS